MKLEPIHIYIGVGALLLFSGGVIVAKLTRPIRTKNPGSLDDTGKNNYGNPDGIDTPRNDGRLLRFKTPADGVNALAIQIYYTVVNHKNNTPRKFIASYSPSSDGNDEEMYRNKIAKALGIGVDDKIDYKRDVVALVDIISRVETGANIRTVWGPRQVDKGIQMALINRGIA